MNPAAAEHGMGESDDITNLEELLDRLDEASDGEERRVSMEQVLNTVGRRSFGPVLLIPGLIALSPLSGIPGAPTMVGVMVLLVTGQLLLGRSEFWLPKFVLRRSVARSRYDKSVKLLRPVARFVDRLIKPRLPWLVGPVALHVIAAICLMISLAAPLMEAVPFAITGVGAGVTAFGLALIARDGLLALLAGSFWVATATVTGVMVL